MQEEQLGKLSEKIRGKIITPKRCEFEVARKVYNEMIDRRPAAIVRCADVADVRAAVNFAREDGLTVAIRGGRHNGAGLGVCDQGVVIDLLPTRGIRVDPAKGTVRVEGGYTQGDMDDPNNFFHINQNIKPE